MKVWQARTRSSEVSHSIAALVFLTSQSERPFPHLPLHGKAYPGLKCWHIPQGLAPAITAGIMRTLPDSTKVQATHRPAVPHCWLPCLLRRTTRAPARNALRLTREHAPRCLPGAGNYAAGWSPAKHPYSSSFDAQLLAQHATSAACWGTSQSKTLEVVVADVSAHDSLPGQPPM